MLPSVVLQTDWKQTQERMKYGNKLDCYFKSGISLWWHDAFEIFFLYFLMKTKHVSNETSSITRNMFCFHWNIHICIYKMNFKSIVWFIKATSYSVLLRSLGNTSKVIMSVSLIRHTTYCYFSTFHLCTGKNYFSYCCFLRRHKGVETAI